MISSSERYMKTGKAIEAIFQSNFAIFYPANPCYGAKLSIFVAVSTKNTTVFGCRIYDRTHAPL